MFLPIDIGVVVIEAEIESLDYQQNNSEQAAVCCTSPVQEQTELQQAVVAY